MNALSKVGGHMIRRADNLFRVSAICGMEASS